MKRAMHVGLVAMLATQVLVLGQTQDVAKILADVRAALGGEAKLAAVRTLTIEGKTARPSPNGTAQTSDFDIAFEFPGKYARKDTLGVISGMSIARTAGFNGDGLVEQVETPPQMGGGQIFVRAAGSGPMTMPGEKPTPEQEAAQRQASLIANKKDFARLTLGMFATSYPSYPLEFAYGGIAESPEGKAHIIDVKGADDFAVKLFVDTETHLPLMLSWMDKEPLRMMNPGMRAGGPVVMPGAGAPGAAQTVTRGGTTTQTVTRSGGPGMSFGGANMTPEEIAKMRADMDARMKEAEARRRVVEYRLFYGDYKAFDGIRLPTRIQRMIDGEATEEMEFDRVRVNGRVDQKKFEVVK